MDIDITAAAPPPPGQPNGDDADAGDDAYATVGYESAQPMLLPQAFQMAGAGCTGD